MTNRFARLLPPLAELSALELELVLTTYGSYSFSRRHSFRARFAEVVFVAVIILAEIVGLVTGWIYWHGLWGLITGSTLALILGLVLCYGGYLFGMLFSLYRWLKSEQGRFVSSHTKSYEQFVLHNTAGYDI